MFGKIAVVSPLAVGCVANDGVGDVLEVAAQLMATARDWVELKQGITAACVAVDCYSQFDFGKFLEMG